MLIDGLPSQDDAYRYNCFKLLFKIRREQPRTLYPDWDEFVPFLASRDVHHRSAAVQILTGLVRVDEDNRGEEILEDYFWLLHDESVFVARYAARHAGEIAVAKPHLQSRITDRLLALGQMQNAARHAELVKADAIDSLALYFEESADQARILAFVEAQMLSASPGTRATAKRFLKRFGGL